MGGCYWQNSTHALHPWNRMMAHACMQLPASSHGPGRCRVSCTQVKKVIKLFPVQVAATGFYNLHTRQFSHKLSCKDVMLRCVGVCGV
jgi:hypothetical protein